jgi:hypothetical protein
MPSLLSRNRCRQKVVRLIPGRLRVLKAASCHELRQKVELVQQLIVEFTSTLVCREFLMAFRGDFQRIPPHDDGPRLLGLVKPKQKVGKANDRSRTRAVLAPDRLRESVVGAMGE